MARQLTQAAITAKAIKKELKEIGIKANVTSRTYSMGDSVTVNTFNLNPAVENTVKKICKKYQYRESGIINNFNEYENFDETLPAQVAFIFIINKKETAA